MALIAGLDGILYNAVGGVLDAGELLQDVLYGRREMTEEVASDIEGFLEDALSDFRTVRSGSIKERRR